MFISVPFFRHGSMIIAINVGSSNESALIDHIFSMRLRFYLTSARNMYAFVIQLRKVAPFVYKVLGLI